MATAVVVAAQRQRWQQCGGNGNAVTGVPLARENSSGKRKIVPRIVSLNSAETSKKCFFEEDSALLKVLFEVL